MRKTATKPKNSYLKEHEMLCPDCGSEVAQYGRDYKKCNICGWETGGQQGTVRGRRLNPSPETSEPATAENGTRSLVRRKAYKSAMKRGIRSCLVQHPALTNLEICRHLDDDGQVPSERMLTRERSFES